MLSKEEIINLILVNDKPQRLVAMVQEAFLVNRVFPAMYCKGVSDGWFTAGSSKKDWYHYSCSDEMSDVDKDIFNSLKNDFQCERVVLISTSLQKSQRGAVLKIKETDGISGALISEPREIRVDALSVNKTPSHWISERDQQAAESVQEYLFCMDDDYLNKLLAGRLLLNRVYGSLRPVDIDAFYVRKNNRKFVLEYKRKWPMQGFYPAKKTLQVQDVRGIERKVRSRLAATNRSSDTQQVLAVLNAVLQESFSDLLEPERIAKKAFGLDLSHAANVELCRNNGWGYSYLIWKAGAPKKISDHLQLDLSPINPFLIYKDLEPEHFCGITFTINKDSGSFDKNFRLQLCLSADEGEFKKAEKLHAHFSG